MRRTLIALTLSLAYIITGFSQEIIVVSPESDHPEITFESTEIDYGVIEHNADPNREFKFTNTGDAPLIISHAKGSCGCTVPTWPKEPIAPGEEGVIKVRYATNRIGKFNKTVTLTTNDETGSHVLRIKGEVLKPVEETPTNSDDSGK